MTMKNMAELLKAPTINEHTFLPRTAPPRPGGGAVRKGICEVEQFFRATPEPSICILYDHVFL